MRVCTGGRADRRSCRRSISSRRSSTTRTPTARLPRPTRVSDIYAMGGAAAHRARDRRRFPSDGLEPRHDPRRSSAAASTSCARPAWRCSAATPSRTRRSSSATPSPAPSIPARVLSNAGARPGDVLFLTKPLGTGIVGTAIKFERVAGGDRRRRRRVDADAEPGGRRGAAGAAGRRGPRLHRRHRLRAGRARLGNGGGERRHARPRRRARCPCFDGVLDDRRGRTGRAA